MTGEMFKPENAHRKEEWFWREMRLPFGGSYLGDDGVLIYPNYPEIFDLAEKIKKNTGLDATPEPFDVYQGAYIRVHGSPIKIWVAQEEGYSMSGLWYIEPYGDTLQTKDIYEYLRQHAGDKKLFYDFKADRSFGELMGYVHKSGNLRLKLHGWSHQTKQGKVVSGGCSIEIEAPKTSIHMLKSYFKDTTESYPNFLSNNKNRDGLHFKTARPAFAYMKTWIKRNSAKIKQLERNNWMMS